MPTSQDSAQKRSPQFLIENFTFAEGFTLVELLVVITIIVITTAAIIPSFTGYLRNQGVKQGVEQVKSDIRSIQNKALTGALSDQSISGNPVTHWGIRFGPGTGTGSPTYEFFISTDTTCPGGAIPAAQLQGTGSLTSDLQIKIGAYRCMFFSISNGDITSNLAGNLVIVGYVGSAASGDCRRLFFNANGLVYSSTSILCT